MSYWPNLLLACGGIVLLALAGRLVASFFPVRLRPLARTWLSPVLGLALYVVVATAIGWLFGMQRWVVVSITILITGIALGSERDHRSLLRLLPWLVLGTALISFGPLLSVWRHGGFNVYHDAFTYITHSQWLQEHPFREEVIPAILKPAYTQVSLYQDAGFRMGASFFFAWAQSCSFTEWSVFVYPGVVTLLLAVGAHAVGGLMLALFPAAPRWMVPGWILTAGTSVSGFAYGCFTGFLPQLAGVSLVAGMLALLVIFRPARTGHIFLHPLPLALTFSALGFAYSELLPFTGLAVIGWFAVALRHRPQRKNLLLAGAVFTGWTLLLLNFECVRILRALLVQSNVVVGWPVPWAAGDFVAHAIGLHSGSGDGDWWMLPPLFARLLAFSFVALLGAMACACLVWQRRWLERWSPALAFFGVCALAFVFFRYGKDSPWPVGTGQSWNQFKLSNWCSPLLLAATGALIAAVARSRAGALVAVLVLAGLLHGNIRAHLALGPTRINEALRLTGRSTRLFQTYLDIRRAAEAAEPPGVIYVDLGGSDYKSRQIVAYFLHDFAVVGDWTGDGYIVSRLPPGWEAIAASDATWWIYRKSDPGLDSGLLPPAGILAFTPVPAFQAKRLAVTGGYAEEGDHSGWWRWSAESVSTRLQIHSKMPVRVRLKFTCIVAADPRELDISVRAGSQAVTKQVSFAEGWQEYTSEPLELNVRSVDVVIDSKATPVPLGGNDPRQVKFLIKNVRLEPVPES